MDPKLQTAPSGDYIGPRHSISSMFMQKEPETMRVYADDLETSLETNRRLLMDVIGMTLNSLGGTGETEEEVGSLPRQIQETIQRNKTINESLHSVITARNEAQGRALINEQIAHEYQQKELESTKEFEEQLGEFDYQIEKREKIYTELMIKLETLQQEAQIVRKTKDVKLMPLSEDSLKMHNLVEGIRRKMQVAGRELHNVRIQREKLEELSRELAADLSKAQAAVRNPINRRAGSDWGHELPRRDYSFDGGPLPLSSSSSSSSLSDHIVLPDKVHIQTQTKPTLPTLDLVKVKMSRRRSLQDESFKKPQKTPKEEKLEEEMERLTAQAEEIGKQLESLTLRLFELNEENNSLSSENAHLVEEVMAARALIDTSDKTHVPKTRAHLRSAALTGTPVSTLMQRPAGPQGEIEGLMSSDCLYGDANA